MVLIHYKKTDHNQFLYQAPRTTSVEELILQLVNINNTRIIVDLFACAVQDLANHGPLKPQEIRGLSTLDLMQNALVMSSEDKKKWCKFFEPGPDERKNEDSTHYRIGIQKSEEVVKMMIETSIKAKKLISYTQVDHKFVLSVQHLHAMIDQLRGAVMIAYPGWTGLGEWEPALLIINQKYDFFQRSTNNIDYLDIKDATLWFAGNQMIKGKIIQDYTKSPNQKSKIIVKLAKSGTGAPVRQAAISEKLKVELMSHYHKKEEEMKKLRQDNEDQYLNAAWADSQSLKKSLVGGRDIRYR